MKFRKPTKLLLYLLSVFFFQEIAFRYFFPVPEIKNLDRINYMNLHPDANGLRYLRHQTWQWQSTADTAVVFKHLMNHCLNDLHGEFI